MNHKFIYIFLFAFIFACKSSQPLGGHEFAQLMKSDVNYLASDELKGREVGTENEKKAARYIAAQMQISGLEGLGDDGGYFQVFQTRKKSNPHALTTSENDPLIEGWNVLGFDNNGSEYTIVIGAHFDHLGYGPEGSLYTGPPAIHNGADDNASGVAAMLELIRRLANQDLNNNILFMAFSGEEKGLWGSNYFNKNPTLDIKSINYMINMDMVGRLNEERKLAIYGIGTSSLWKSNIEAIKDPQFDFSFTESGVGPSDHTSFYLSDIPVLHFFTGQHAQYHKPSDDVNLINFEGMEDIVEFIEKLVLRLDDDGKLDFKKTNDASDVAPSFKVTLGVMPDYLYDGEGMRIDGVIDGRPASKAEFLKGDIVLKMGDHEVKDMMGYMEALSKFAKGDTVTVIVKREGEMIEKKVTFQ